MLYDALARVNEEAASLNECLNSGPLLQNKLWSILVHSQFHPVIIVRDTKQAFLQVHLREKDRDALRFHLLKDLTTETVEVSRFTRALFGLPSSPFLLGRIIQHLIESCRSAYPDSVKKLEKSLYMDDLISGGSTSGKVQQLKSTVIQIFAHGTFELHKWDSNNPVLDSTAARPTEGEKETYGK